MSGVNRKGGSEAVNGSPGERKWMCVLIREVVEV